MSERDDVKRVRCPYCSAGVGKPCIYLEGPFRGGVKMSGPHGERLALLQKPKAAS